jgi:hypothetical protein
MAESAHAVLVDRTMIGRGSVVRSINASRPFSRTLLQPVEDFILKPDDLLWTQINSTWKFIRGFKTPEMLAGEANAKFDQFLVIY